MMEPLTAPETFEFPFPPYDIQHKFMKTLYGVIENRKLGIFESPTGTGKSLSIICGAIRWLKDHETARRETLNSKICNLEEKKLEVSSASSSDWLTCQSQEIELQREINNLKLDIGKVNEYDQKIEAIKKKVKSIKVKKWPSKEKSQDLGSAEEPKEEKRDDEDLVLEEDSKDESDNEDDTENKHRPTKIFICSRTHSQLAQFVGEILKSPYSQTRVASLASRQIYCVNPNVSRLTNFSLINERCLDLQKGSKQQDKSDADGKVTKRRRAGESCKCPFYKQGAIEDLKDSVLTQVQDVEDLVSNAKKLCACPFYASRLAAEDAEVVLVPYNVLLHKATREANGIDLKDNVVIVDEAHNLLEAMAQMHNHELTYVQVTEALRQVKCYKQRFNVRFSAANLLSINQLIFVMSKLQQLLDKAPEKTKVMTVQSFVLTAEIDNYNMFKMIKFCKDSRIAQKVRGYAMKYPFDKEKVKEKRPAANKGLKDFLASIENKKNEESTKKGDSKDDEEEKIDEKPLVLSNPLLSVISFLESLTCTYEDGRVFIHEDKKLQFLLLNPSNFFTEIVQEARSVILAGGTMNPISEFERLFVNSGADRGRMERFSCDHIIPPENILPIIVRKGPKQEDLLFNFENRFSMGNNLKSILQECCKTVKGGIVVFFPSYKYENWVHSQIKDVPLGRQIFREPQDRSVTVESVLEKYAKAISQPSSPGALLLSVVGGKLSEGLNFSDDLGRCVIVVGLPYANIMAADLKEKMAYWDKQEGSGAGRRFYENQCMKAVNQSIGRAVRHKNDYATILLLDERYSRASVKTALPNWIKKSLKVCNFQETFQCIQQFFKNRQLE